MEIFVPGGEEKLKSKRKKIKEALPNKKEEEAKVKRNKKTEVKNGRSKKCCQSFHIEPDSETTI